ncbi:MAG: extensin family protein, partial [Rhizobiales bacterium]|nr:extensin family protein [Hyphomicrobiales bacterium]
RAASRLAAWVSEVAEPVVLSKAGSPLAYVKTGPGHVCLGKSGEALALRNEHSAGNAIDVAAFATADGRMIGVNGATSLEVSLLKGLTTSACGYFTTVLAPSAAPGSHYHFDLGRHGKGGAARICE